MGSFKIAILIGVFIHFHPFSDTPNKFHLKKNVDVIEKVSKMFMNDPRFTIPSTCENRCFSYPLVNIHIAIENGPVEIVDFPS